MPSTWVRIGPLGPFTSPSGRGLSTNKVPAANEDVLRLGDIGSILKPGFSQIDVADQDSLYATALKYILTIAVMAGLQIETDAVTNTLTFSILYGDEAGTVCEGNDPRLSDAREPLAHAITHEPTGSDPITSYITDDV